MFPMAYLLFFWPSTGRTPGKAFAGLRVVRSDGGRLRFTTSVVRIAGYAVSIWTLGLGFLAILFRRNRRGWHDTIAGTRVVYTWPAAGTTSTSSDEQSPEA